MTLTSWLALAGLAVWVGYEVVLRRCEDAQATSWDDSGTDRGSTRILVSCFVVSAVVVVALAVTGIGELPALWRWAGIGALVLGLAMRAWGMATLGRHYTRTVREVDEHQLVMSGPYAVIRHPGYAGTILVWCGYALASAGWVAALVVGAVMLAAYGYRVHTEEALLRGVFGQKYEEYRQRTWRLVPFVY
jgi:protein-S-isoprenylcysteine O-methyltransferase Ste14